MIKNLVVNGCSCTSPSYSWGQQVADHYSSIQSYYNLAKGGAGNLYIAESTINFLVEKDLDPAETLVLIMWSGTGRKDIRVAGEWFYHIQEEYRWGASSKGPLEDYYIFSGGINNSWTENPISKNLFSWLYKTSDPQVLCRDSLMNFMKLENFLKLNGYPFKFTAISNYWNPTVESTLSGDYGLGYFCQDLNLYKKADRSVWFFADEHKNGMLNYALALDQMDSTQHPTAEAYAEFAQQCIYPEIDKYFS